MTWLDFKEWLTTYLEVITELNHELPGSVEKKSNEKRTINKKTS